MTSALHESQQAMQLMLLLAFLPVLAALAVMGGWALLRLHARPRSGWIVLWIVALTGLQVGGMSLLWSQLGVLFGLVGPAGLQILNLGLLVLHYGLELGIWWLALLGLFGPDPFRMRKAPPELTAADPSPQ